MKSKKLKYYIAEVEEQQGEYTHTTKYLFKTAGDPFKYADNVSKNWYNGEKAEKDEYSNGYWQNGGDILSSVGEVKQVSIEDYEVLTKYLNVL